MLDKLKILLLKNLGGSTIERVIRKLLDYSVGILLASSIPFVVEFGTWLASQAGELTALLATGVIALLSWVLSVKSDKKLEKDTVIRVNQKLQ